MKDEFSTAFINLVRDERVTVWHISMYVALLYLWQLNEWKDPVSITRREIMRLAHIKSIATYHKCLRELQQYGIIEYIPSYDPTLGSLVKLYQIKE